MGHCPPCLPTVVLCVTRCLSCPRRNSWSFQKFLRSHSQRRSQVCSPCTALASAAPIPCSALRPCPSVSVLGNGRGQQPLEWGQAQLSPGSRSTQGSARCSIDIWSLPWGAPCVAPAAPVTSCTCSEAASCPETPHSTRRLHQEFLPCLRQARLAPTALGQSHHTAQGILWMLESPCTKPWISLRLGVTWSSSHLTSQWFGSSWMGITGVPQFQDCQSSQLLVPECS